MSAAMRVGSDIPAFTVDAVDLEHMKAISSIMRDPNPIHWSADEVRRRGLGDRPVNQGPANIAYVMNMLTAFAGDATAIRRLRLRCQGVVFAGERVVARGVVTSIDGAGGGRLVDCAVWLEGEDGRRVLDGVATIAAGEEGAA
jgi:acyl dehydratase